MKLRYRILNVFTRDGAPLSGNPLCVFEDGRGLDDARMQALARQFNLSETTFILPSQQAAARVRIFTPSYEMPFAGHPTLGTAQVVRALGLGGDSLELEMAAGIIPVSAAGNHWTLRARPATVRELGVPLQELAGWLGLDPADLAPRPLWVKSGREQLVVPLTRPELLPGLRPRPEALERLVSADGATQLYFFAPLDDQRILARFFFPDGGALLEDPATGSACANLGAWFLATGATLPLARVISQGEFIGRPSTLRLEINAQREVFVGGEVIELGSGHLELQELSP